MDASILVKIIADGLVVPIVIIGAVALLFGVKRGDRFSAYSRILMAGLTAYLIAKFIGFVYQPAQLRPFELLGLEPGAAYLDNPGFPSDHMLFVTAIACAVWAETKMRKIALLISAMAILVGIGRVAALVHTPLDVIGGAIVALIGALWYCNGYRVGRRRL